MMERAIIVTLIVAVVLLVASISDAMADDVRPGENIMEINIEDPTHNGLVIRTLLDSLENEIQNLPAIFEAQREKKDKIKYCINPFTQEIIAVPAGMPCPYPTHEA